MKVTHSTKRTAITVTLDLLEMRQFLSSDAAVETVRTEIRKLMYPETSHRQAKAEGFEFDLHVWAKPETKKMTALYTVSRGKRAVCIDQTIGSAMVSIREELEGDV